MSKGKRVGGDYISLCWEGMPEAYYVKGHVSFDEACGIVAREERFDPAALHSTRKYARFVFRQEGTPDGCDHTLKVYSVPAPGRFKVTEVKSLSAWHEGYKARLMERGLDAGFAQTILDAGLGGFDYDDDPSDAADEELSCWSE